MDKAERAQLAEISRIKEAMKKTTSKCLLSDYGKNLRRLKRELREYRMYKYGKTTN